MSSPHLCWNPVSPHRRANPEASGQPHTPGGPLGADWAKNFLGASGLWCAGWGLGAYLVPGLVYAGSGPLPQQVVCVPQVIDGALHLLPLAGSTPSAYKKHILGSRIPSLAWDGYWRPDQKLCTRPSHEGLHVAILEEEGQGKREAERLSYFSKREHSHQALSPQSVPVPAQGVLLVPTPQVPSNPSPNRPFCRDKPLSLSPPPALRSLGFGIQSWDCPRK